MNTYQNQTALITGASMGIGESFARALAGRGANLILVARSKDKLDKLAAELTNAHKIRAEVIAEDLTQPKAAERIYQEAQRRGLTADLLINNAGFATYGRLEELPRERQREEITLNCASLVEMTHAFLPAMLSRGRGGVINVASTAAFQPVPYMAVYGATKAFVLSFSEALWAENRHRGVKILALCPGATETPFFEVVAAPEASLGKREQPEVVVTRALKALEAGRSHLISGVSNYLISQLSRVLPRATTAKTTARLMRPKRQALSK